MLNPNDIRLYVFKGHTYLQTESITDLEYIDSKENQLKQKKKEEAEKEKAVRRVCVQLVEVFSITGPSSLLRAPVASSLFLNHNTALVPPYRVLIDTNFINFSLQNKLELVSGMMDCLYAKCGCFDDPICSSSSLLCRYTVCNRLCNSRTRKTRTTLSLSFTVCTIYGPSLAVLTSFLAWLATLALSVFIVHTQGHMPTIV
jgi:hypothetical protein